MNFLGNTVIFIKCGKKNSSFHYIMVQYYSVITIYKIASAFSDESIQIMVKGL